MDNQIYDVKSSTRTGSPIRLRADSSFEGQLTIPSRRYNEQPEEQVIDIPLRPSAKSCRICLQQNEPLLTPCNCKGSVEHVHEHCLKSWIQKSGQPKKSKRVSSLPCELCSASIKYVVEKKRNCKKNALGEACKTEARIISVKLLILIFLPLTCGFLAAVAYQSFQSSSQQAALKVSVWLAIVALAISIILLFVFVWMLYVFISDYAIQKEIKITLIPKELAPLVWNLDSSNSRINLSRIAPDSLQALAG